MHPGKPKAKEKKLTDLCIRLINQGRRTGREVSGYDRDEAAGMTENSEPKKCFWWGLSHRYKIGHASTAVWSGKGIAEHTGVRLA